MTSVKSFATAAAFVFAVWYAAPAVKETIVRIKVATSSNKFTSMFVHFVKLGFFSNKSSETDAPHNANPKQPVQA